MRQIGDKFHFKGYVWEIADRYQNGYALQRKTKNSLYEHNGWVTENYGVFDTDENKPEQIKRPRFNHCEHCNKFWEGSHYCKVRNSPERIKARKQKARERRRIRLSGNILEIPIETEEEII